jgi:hypothetical protein
MTAPKIYADFNNLDDHNCLKVTCAGTRSDLDRLGVQLQEGLELTFCMDDADDQGQPDELRVLGKVTFSTGDLCWVADVDWASVRHESDERHVATNGTVADSRVSAPDERSGTSRT